MGTDILAHGFHLNSSLAELDKRFAVGQHFLEPVPWNVHGAIFAATLGMGAASGTHYLLSDLLDRVKDNG